MEEIKKEFPIFENYKKEFGQDLIYLDSAASSLTPQRVVDKMVEYYSDYRSHINKSTSSISLKATREFNNSKLALAKYLNTEEENIIWTNGSTDASNLLIDLLLENNIENISLEEGDEILTTILEHHSSLLPLQKLAKAKKMELVFLELDSDFNLEISNLENLITEKTKIVSITFASNLTGTLVNIEKLAKKIKELNQNIFFIVDATSAFGHMAIDMNKLGKYIDAMYFSLHKAFGVTGVGALWLRREISRHMKPVKLGGGIVSHVERNKAEFRSDVKAFEAGTANMAGIISVFKTIEFLEEIKENSLKHSQELVEYFLEKIKELNNKYTNILEIKTFSAPVENNIGIVSFSIKINKKELMLQDIAKVFSQNNINIRVGHHCAEPLVEYLGSKNGFARVSFHIYNTKNDIDILVKTIEKLI